MIDIIVAGDNGPTGSFCIMDLKGNVIDYFHTPVIKSQDYTKKDKNISRLDYKKFLFGLFRTIGNKEYRILSCAIERPFITNFRFKNSIIAARLFEATLICFEEFGIKPMIVDSKEWQSEILPNVKGREELKAASDEWCKIHHPKVSICEKGKKGQDLKTDPGKGDSILIAEWARRNWLLNQ